MIPDQKVLLQVNSHTYEIECELGAGSFGSVYKAKETDKGQLSAIKVIDFQRILNKDYGTKGIELAKR